MAHLHIRARPNMAASKGCGNNPHFHIESTGSVSRQDAAVGRTVILFPLFLEIRVRIFSFFLNFLLNYCCCDLETRFVRVYLFKNR